MEGVRCAVTISFDGPCVSHIRISERNSQLFLSSTNLCAAIECHPDIEVVTEILLELTCIGEA